MLEDFDLDGFWEDSSYARKNYVEGPVTPALLRSVEKELGFKLPRSYVALMRSQNGGHPTRTAFPTKKATSWAEDHIEITGFLGIGRKKPYSLLGKLGSRFAQDERGYPTWGVCICDCPSAGHDMVMLDYRKCGPEGEPAVVHVDQEFDYRVTKLAPDFETFVRGLVDSDELQTDDDDAVDVDPGAVLAAELRVIKTGRFNKPITRLLARSSAPRKNDNTLRRLLGAIATKHNGLVLFTDPISFLVYDLLFSLFITTRTVRTPEAFLDAYPDLLAHGDGDGVVRTGDYGRGVVEDWMRARLARGQIVKRDGKLSLSDAHRAAMKTKLAAYR